MPYECDAIVIGGGGAGKSAAITACEARARVDLTERVEQRGDIADTVLFPGPGTSGRVNGIETVGDGSAAP